MLTSLLLGHILLFIYQVKKTWRILFLSGLCLFICAVYILYGLPSMVWFLNHEGVKLTAGIGLTLILFRKVLEPKIIVHFPEDDLVRFIFRGMIFFILLISSNAIIYSLGMIVYEGNSISMALH
jgi:hypothetical protein